jgi:hypothetical protein
MPGEDDLDELLERILGACDLLDGRLDAVEMELGAPSPAPASVRRDSGNVPTQGGWQSPVDETGLKGDWRYCTITLTDALIGTVISPGPDQFITRLEKTRNQWPAFQVENWDVLPYPHGTWRAGRFLLREGNGRRLYNFASQSNGEVILLGASIRFTGDLTLECLPAGEEWRIDFSDVPTARLQAA